MLMMIVGLPQGSPRLRGPIGFASIPGPRSVRDAAEFAPDDQRIYNERQPLYRPRAAAGVSSTFWV